MKVRLGFVSNSSSSSFCLLGIYLPENFSEDDFYDILDNKAFQTILYIENGIYNYYDQKIIGVTPDRMKEDETLAQFKERICQEFKKFGLDVKSSELGWFIDGGYNG